MQMYIAENNRLMPKIKQADLALTLHCAWLDRVLVHGRSHPMKRHFESLTLILLLGASLLVMRQIGRAQDGYPDSQQPMEIPVPNQKAQYPPQPGPYPQQGQYPPQQGYPQGQGPQQGYPQQ